MKVNTLVAVALSSLFAASIAYAAPVTDNNIGAIQPSTSAPLADNSMDNAPTMSGSSSMSGSASMSDGSNMSGSSSISSDDGAADTATGDDY